MKKLFVTMTLMMVFGSLGYGQKMTTEQTLMKMEQEMADAIVKGDMSVYDKYSADNSVFTDPGGMMMTKAQSLAMFKSGDLKLESIKMDNMKVQMFGNTAVVTYTSMDKGTYKGRDISGEYRWTDVFVKTGGKWKLVAGQGTPIMKQ
ncbi:MAG: nuclear transport factor 2 family protein [Pyrinomonadaceae bacterium]|nr:nuclear transport factor 2 family protein [Blastocatellia bacterium]MDQ3220056.1 nuclear transport factor 2 family protein [Acidobacteriota bacterium]